MVYNTRKWYICYSLGHFKLLLPAEGSVGVVIPTGAYKLVKEYTSTGFTSIAPVDFTPSNVEPNESQDQTFNGVNTDIDTSFEDFTILLARCKRNIRVLKRVPRAARVLAANKLAQCVEECLVPVRVNNVSLATSVKRNIMKPELIFTRPAKKKAPTCDIKGEVRILSSTDILSPQDISTFEQLKAKYKTSCTIQTNVVSRPT